MGILLGFISTGANLFVPQLAQKLINNFKSISPTLAILTVVIFIAGLITSALSGLLLVGEMLFLNYGNNYGKNYLKYL